MKHILILLLVITAFKAEAQNMTEFELIQGPIEEEKRSSFYKTVCSWNDYYIIIRRIKNGYSLEKLNEKLTSVKAIDVSEFEDTDGKKRMFSDVICVNDKIYLITVKYIKKKSNTTYMQEIDPDNFELTGEVKVMNVEDLTVKKKAKTRFIFAGIGMSNLMAEVGELSGGRFIFSPDRKKILTYTKTFDDRDGPDVIGATIKNEDFTDVWENDSISLPYNSLLFDIDKVRLTNSGDILLSGMEYFEKRKSKKDNLPNYKYHLLCISEQGKKINDYDIKLSGKFITDIQFELLDEENIIVTGFYSELDASSVKGAFYIKINLKTKEVITQKMKDFSFDFIVSGLSERQKEKQEKKKDKGKEIELLDFYLDEMIINENGSISLIAEQFEIVEYQTYSPGANGQPGRWETHYKYFYNDIIVVNFKADGEINWTTKINKVQVSTDDRGYYSSYAHTYKNNQLYLVYNDHPDNMEQTDESKMRTFIRGKETSQIVVKIDADGKMSKDEFFKSERGEVILQPKAGVRSESGDLMLYSNRRKEYQFSLLKFK